MKKNKQLHLLLDFDSTFIDSEGLDALAEMSLKGHPEKNLILQKITTLTTLGMEGKISFKESLRERIKLLNGNKKHINDVTKLLKKKISTSILRNKTFIKDNNEQIFIISGGFKELILPVVKQFGIKPTHIFANTFRFDTYGNIVGIDEKNPMSQDGGKVKVVTSFRSKKNIYVIGDGYTDFELKKFGLAKKFIAFTENIERSVVIKEADAVAPNFDEFLYANNLPRSLSYPKNRISVLIATTISKKEESLLKKEGYKITFNQSITEKQLEKLIKNVSILYTDSRTPISSEILKHANRLLAMTISDKQIDPQILSIAQQKGICIFTKKNTSATTNIISYINTGNSQKSITFPQIKFPQESGSHRLLHYHKNAPGVLAQINNVFAKNNINILGQYLRTTNEVGYVITDIDKKYNKRLLRQLKQIPHTIRFRILY